MSAPSRDADFVYDLPRLLWLRQEIAELARAEEPALRLLRPPDGAPRLMAVLAASFNPLTRAHEAIVAAGLAHGADAALLLLPLRALDKEGVERATLADRALVALAWAERRGHVAVALANRGLYRDQALLLAGRFPSAHIAFLAGYDKVVQIFDHRYYHERDAALRELFAAARLWVAPRAGQGAAELGALLDRTENQPFAGHLELLPLGAAVDALSSTLVREAARSGGDWEALVSAETAAFMRETQPYAAPVALDDGEVVDVYGLRQRLLDAIAAGRLAGGDFAALCRQARATTPEGRTLRALLSRADV